MIPLYNVDGTSTCPLGFPMSQNRLAVPIWSYAMEILPPARVIELGTANGGFTCALAIHLWNLGATLHTYDRAAPNERYAKLMKFLGVNCLTGDIFGVTKLCEHDIATKIRLPGTTFLLCDGGDKPRELATFARYLKPGDVIAGHDYDAMHEVDPASPMNERPWQWCELRKHQGDAVALEHGLEPFMQEHFDLAGWLCYRKT